MMNRKWSRQKIIGLSALLLLGLSLAGWFTYDRYFRPVTLKLGLYTGSSWGVPKGNEYELIDQVIKTFEKKHPRVKVVYESGIAKEDYSSWLSDALINGQEPDIFVLPENDFNLLASTGSLKKLDGFVSSDLKTSDFYHSAYQAGSYAGHQYALPYESNPTMMCINKDLLEKEGISIPKSGWTLSDFYRICKQVTRDTDGDGVLDRYGLVGYSWQQALAAYDAPLFDTYGSKAYFNTENTKAALSFLIKLNELNPHYSVTTEDFDQGKVAFLPMTLAQYRTYKPYPYHVSKYSSFSWTCVQMPSVSPSINATQVDTSLYGLSSRTHHSKLAWEFLKTLTDNQKTQQALFETSQGSSVLKKVMKSSESKELLKNDDFGSTALTVDTLDSMMSGAATQPKFKQYNTVLEKADYLISQAVANKTVDSDLADIQRQIEDQLK